MYYYYINKFQTSTIAGQLNWNVKHGEKNSLCFTWGFEHSMGRQSTYNDIYVYVCILLLFMDCSALIVKFRKLIYVIQKQMEHIRYIFSNSKLE